MNLSGGWPCARIRAAAPGVIAASASALLRLETQVPQAAEELAIDFIGVRLQQNGEPLQMHAKLVA